MKILLLGKNGQIGWELQRSLTTLGELIALDRHQADLENPDSLKQCIKQYRPNILVNAAAYTAVDKAEIEINKAQQINATAIKVLSEELTKQKGWFIHYSTDYVFDGTKDSPYVEEDMPSPQNVYGKSKHIGEELLQTSGCFYLILRTSWIYAIRGNNFAKTILRLSQEKEQLNIISDQFGAPTSAKLVADVTSLILYRLLQDKAFASKASGIYHLTAAGKTSWHGFALALLSETQRQGRPWDFNLSNLHPIPTHEYPLPAKRPQNSCLSTDKLRNKFGITLPYWMQHMKLLVNELAEKKFSEVI